MLYATLQNELPGICAPMILHIVLLKESIPAVRSCSAASCHIHGLWY